MTVQSHYIIGGGLSGVYYDKTLARVYLCSSRGDTFQPGPLYKPSCRYLDHAFACGVARYIGITLFYNVEVLTCYDRILKK